MSTKKKTTTGKPGGKSEPKSPVVPVFETEPDEKPKHCIIGHEYVVQTDEGELRISLRIRERTMKLMEGLEQTEQFGVLLAENAPSWVEKIDELDTTDVTILRGFFFYAFSHYQAARLGEALGSSA